MDETIKYVSKMDLADFRGIMESYGQDIWNYAYFLTGKSDVADDISQETFIRAYRSLNTFRGNSSLKTWLLKIAHNLTYDYRKKSFFKRIVLMEVVNKIGTSPSAEKEYFSEKTVDDIWSIVQTLPLKLREVLLLDVVHYMKLQEISEFLDIPLGTVKSRLHRARIIVAKQLELEDR
ncbi:MULTISPECIES: RNA polymerase sigma factor [Paenibacillus]|uniref:RNA polymerase sigma factor n=1 Tax=Paenibacillus TaxID=44249 RepID=UPI0022B922D6|nr:RNA polymerase sigma factor [Paenibacillus caseinilyticus]MCZ8521832.1 RNA polymerase sigma factor [Paenibacillus caseinilyticus]